MSTDMRGIYEQSLFARALDISVRVSDQSRYRVLADVLPWSQMADVANKYRSRKVSIVNGRPLNLRLHLGAYVAQSMNNWTDRETEDMVRYHAGVRILCGIADSTESLDRTSNEKFRNMVGPDGAEELNQLMVQSAVGAGFTGSEICASDTTVQEAPIQHPTEVGHMKKIAEKLLGVGKKLGKRTRKAMEALGKKALDIFRDIRLFTRGKAKAAVEKKKQLGKKMHQTVRQMLDLAKSRSQDLPKKVREKFQAEQASLYELMLKQIKQWQKTGKHPDGKIVSLWYQQARAVVRNKASKVTEFGRRWIVTRLVGGYLIGRPTQKLGSDADVKIADEVLMDFMNTVGEVPANFIYDRGGDGERNHEILKNIGVENNCIFPKGPSEKMNVTPAVFEMARRERALSEAGIATIKHERYGFNKPRARLPESCTLKGHTAMLGFNVNHLFADLAKVGMVGLEIT